MSFKTYFFFLICLLRRISFKFNMSFKTYFFCLLSSEITNSPPAPLYFVKRGASSIRLFRLLLILFNLICLLTRHRPFPTLQPGSSLNPATGRILNGRSCLPTSDIPTSDFLLFTFAIYLSSSSLFWL